MPICIYIFIYYILPIPYCAFCQRQDPVPPWSLWKRFSGQCLFLAGPSSQAIGDREGQCQE